MAGQGSGKPPSSRSQQGLCRSPPSARLSSPAMSPPVTRRHPRLPKRLTHLTGVRGPSASTGRENVPCAPPCCPAASCVCRPGERAVLERAPAQHASASHQWHWRSSRSSGSEQQAEKKWCPHSPVPRWSRPGARSAAESHVHVLEPAVRAAAPWCAGGQSVLQYGGASDAARCRVAVGSTRLPAVPGCHQGVPSPQGARVSPAAAVHKGKCFFRALFRKSQC